MLSPVVTCSSSPFFILGIAGAAAKWLLLYPMITVKLVTNLESQMCGLLLVGILEFTA